MTLPQQQPPIIPPFKLQHNLQMSQHPFILQADVHAALMANPDLQLELKCYHHEDPHRTTNWPDAISVSVNGSPVAIQRGSPGRIHKALHIKQLCRGGKKNIITITATACCCSHFFLLHIVHRPSIRAVVQHILRKQILPTESCIDKCKQILAMAYSFRNRNQICNEY